MRKRLCFAGLVALLILPATALAAPAQPVIAGQIASTTTLSGVDGVAVSGHYAFTTAYWSGELVAIDFSDPTHPFVAGSTPGMTSSLLAGDNVTIAGNYAFVASKNRNAAPANPPSTCNTGSNDDGSGNALTIIDVSDPTTPTILGTLQDPAHLFGSYGIAVSGQYAYVASQGLLAGQPCVPDTSAGAFSVIDLSNLSAPHIVGHLDNNNYSGALKNALDHATSVAISGHYAYVTAFYDARMTVIDISNPAAPRVVASLRDGTNLSFPDDVAVQGNYAYIAVQVGGSSNEFTVLDISNPLAPRFVASISDPTVLNNAYRLRLDGNFALVSSQGSDAVVAIDISDPLHPVVAGSVTDPGLNSTTQLAPDSTGRYVVAVSGKLSTETKALYPPYPLQSGGPTATGTVSVVDLDPAAITVPITPSSEPPDGTGQASADFTFSVSDAVAIVRCSLDGGAFVPCTSSGDQAYTGLSAGPHTFTVEATDATGTTASDSYSWSIDAPPTMVSKPVVSGSATLGGQLSTTNGTWNANPAPSFKYQWSRCDPAGNCSAIPGATANAYVLGPQDVAETLEVTVTASNNIGNSAATSSRTAAVTAPPVPTASPAIAGTPRQPDVLTVTAGTWSGYPAPAISYVWQRCNSAGACSVIGGQTTRTHTIVAADVGMRLEVVVTARNVAGSATATTAPTAVVGGPAGWHAAFAGIAHGSPSLHLVVGHTASRSRLKQVTISLPKGLRLRSTKAIEAALKVTEASSKHAQFTARLHRGELVVTFKRPAASCHITLGQAALGISTSLKKAIKQKTTTTLPLDVTAVQTHGVTLHGLLIVAV